MNIRIWRDAANLASESVAVSPITRKLHFTYPCWFTFLNSVLRKCLYLFRSCSVILSKFEASAGAKLDILSSRSNVMNLPVLPSRSSNSNCFWNMFCTGSKSLIVSRPFIIILYRPSSIWSIRPSSINLPNRIYYTRWGFPYTATFTYCFINKFLAWHRTFPQRRQDVMSWKSSRNNAAHSISPTWCHWNITSNIASDL